MNPFNLSMVTHHPLFGLLLTLLAFRCGQWLYNKSDHNNLLQPVAVGMLFVILALLCLDLPYEVYYDSSALLHLLLGPVTVALAIPLYQNLRHIRQQLLPIMVTLIIGSALTVSACIFFAWLLGATELTLQAMLTKSITTPIAMAVADKIGSSAALTAPLVMITGILGAQFCGWVFRRTGVTDDSIKGIALGMTSHAVGTAKALEISKQAGAFAALAMGLTGILTALILPLIMYVLN